MVKIPAQPLIADRQLEVSEFNKFRMRYKPENDLAKLFADLLRVKVFERRHIDGIKRLGFRIVVKPTEPKEL